MAYLLERIEGESVYINVISKSGTTTEPAIAFRLLKAALESKYGKEGAQKRIVATTDRERGALRTLADREGYKTFVIPDDVGGRYSVITPVGLLPIAVGGIDLKAFLNGVNDGVDAFANPLVAENPAYQYAVLRNVLYRKGKAIEVLVNYEPSMAFLAEWWMQLFGESEGKDNMGVFPTKMNNSTDLHSMGQMIQDGPRIMFETVITLDTVERDIVLEADADNLDGLNYLAGKKMSEVNQSAFQGTVEAHVDGNVPNLHVSMPKLDAYHLGHLMYFFMKACGISGYLMGVNPFDQPGVEAYKKNMFRLLGKPM
jgi:glucose-6-phosphate isomerase